MKRPGWGKKIGSDWDFNFDLSGPAVVNDGNILALGTVGVLAVMGLVSSRKGSGARWTAEASSRELMVKRAHLQFDSPSGDDGAAYEKADQMVVAYFDGEEGTGVQWVDETDYRSPPDIDIEDLEEHDE